MTVSIREEFFVRMIRRYLGHGIKTRLVRVMLNGTVQTKGNPRWDICPNVWTTIGTADDIVANIEGVLTLEPVPTPVIHHTRRYRSLFSTASAAAKSANASA